MSSAERRTHVRRTHRTPVGIDTDDHSDLVGVTANVSPGGALLFCANLHAVGERLVLQFRNRDQTRRVTARVLRSWTEPDGHSLFPHLAAVAFESEEPDIEHLL